MRVRGGRFVHVEPDFLPDRGGCGDTGGTCRVDLRERFMADGAFCSGNHLLVWNDGTVG